MFTFSFFEKPSFRFKNDDKKRKRNDRFLKECFLKRWFLKRRFSKRSFLKTIVLQNGRFIKLAVSLTIVNEERRREETFH